MSVKLTSENFENEVLKTNQKVLIDFWANWCGPCRMLHPIVDEIANELETVKICKVNVDEQPELAKKYNVMAVPTMLVVNDGEIENRLVGLQKKDVILTALGQ